MRFSNQLSSSLENKNHTHSTRDCIVFRWAAQRETLMEFNGWHVITNRGSLPIVNAKFVFLSAPDR